MTIDTAAVDKLWQAFSVFDTDGSGAISIEELGEVMMSLGQTTDSNQLRELIEEVDIDRSGSIDFEEFKSTQVVESLELDPQLAQLKALLAQHPQSGKVRGTSRLQMQIGLFRLIQGAAYRCFR